MNGDEVVPIPPVNGRHLLRPRWLKWAMVGVLVVLLSLGSLVAGYVAGQPPCPECLDRPLPRLSAFPGS